MIKQRFLFSDLVEGFRTVSVNDFYLFLGRLCGKNNIGPFPERTENNSLSYYKKQTSEYTIKQTISERAQSVSLTFISDKLRPTCPWCFNHKSISQLACVTLQFDFLPCVQATSD